MGHMHRSNAELRRIAFGRDEYVRRARGIRRSDSDGLYRDQVWLDLGPQFHRHTLRYQRLALVFR